MRKPYLTKKIIIIKRKYNPSFGDNKICICGHPYHRHFDSYDDMAVVGCKYCPCYLFSLNKKKVK